MADLETLTLQINTESQQAFTAIGKLAQRLDSLSVSIAKLETGKLNQLASGLDNLNMVIRNMNDNTSKWDYSRIASNISALTVVNTAGLDNLANSLTTFFNSANSPSFTKFAATFFIFTDIDGILHDIFNSVSKRNDVIDDLSTSDI